jgi:hypothetical protein
MASMATRLVVLLALAAPIAAAAEEQPAQPPSNQAQAPSRAPSPGVTRPQATHRRGRQGTESHFQALVKGLKLDAAQQEKVRQALLAQREAIRRLSSAPSQPGTSRAMEIHAITNRTMERIRAVLNDEQRRLYGQPMPAARTPAQGKPVEEWLKDMRRNGT